MANAEEAGTHTMKYPVQLGIGYLFLAGYLMRTLFISVRLPASVGVIITGFSFSYIFQEDIFKARDELQELAFFLVLLTAGLEIRLPDLKLYIFIMAWLPATFEWLAIAAYAWFVLNFTVSESLVLGCVLVAIGDGLVIPKMKEFGFRFPGHPMPRLVFAWAPLEASYALTLFGVLVGISAPADAPTSNIAVIVLANVVRIVATIAGGAVFGSIAGWCIPKRVDFVLNGHHVFTGAPVESFLLLISVALIACGLGGFVPLGFTEGSLFQRELMVIVTGCFFNYVTEPKTLHDVELILGGLWVFGQLVLFTMLGSRTTMSILPKTIDVLPVIVVGLFFRFVGVLCGIILSLVTGTSGHPFVWSFLIYDAVFCFISTIPRATIQGALGAVPVTQHFFQHFPQKKAAEDFISMGAKIYIVCMSVCGMVVLNSLGPTMCACSNSRCMLVSDEEHGTDDDGGETGKDSNAEMDDAKELAVCLQIISDAYKMTPEAALEVLSSERPCSKQVSLTSNATGSSAQNGGTANNSEPKRSPRSPGLSGQIRQIFANQRLQGVPSDLPRTVDESDETVKSAIPPPLNLGGDPAATASTANHRGEAGRLRSRLANFPGSGISRGVSSRAKFSADLLFSQFECSATMLAPTRVWKRRDRIPST